MLDGTSNFLPLVGFINFMSGRESVNFQIPEVIIVGIDTSDRIRDLTPPLSQISPSGENCADPLPNNSGGGESSFEILAHYLTGPTATPMLITP